MFASAPGHFRLERRVGDHPIPIHVTLCFASWLRAIPKSIETYFVTSGPFRCSNQVKQKLPGARTVQAKTNKRSISKIMNSKQKLLSVMALSAIAITGTLLSSQANEEQNDRNDIAGTWVSIEFGGGNIVSFMSDGRSIGSIPINLNVGNGPNGEGELAGPAHGEWIRTGNHQFSLTSYNSLSHPSVGLTHLIKLTGHYTLDKATDLLTLTDPMIAVYLPDGNLQFPPVPGAVTHFKRVIVGH
jgi:hypothetical protein